MNVDVQIQKADYDCKLLLTFPSGRQCYLWLGKGRQYDEVKEIIESEAKLRDAKKLAEKS